jgi:hypothetical protein
MLTFDVAWWGAAVSLLYGILSQLGLVVWTELWGTQNQNSS